MKKTLLKWFDYYNGVLFDNKLNQIPIKLTKSSKKLGSFRYKMLPNKEYEPISITISKNFELTNNELKSVLVHEMIHYYCLITGEDNNINGGHSGKFIELMDMANEKCKELKVEIKSKDGASKEVIPFVTYLILKDKDTKENVGILRPAETKLKYYVDLLSNLYVVETFLSDNKILYNAIKKVVSKLTYYKYNDDIKNIVNESK